MQADGRGLRAARLRGSRLIRAHHLAGDVRPRCARAGAVPPAAEEAEEERRGVFRRLRESLSKSRQALSEEISASFFDRIDDETWERLEEALILADAGAPTTAAVVERLEQEVEAGTVPADGAAVRERLIEILAEVAGAGGREPIDLSGEPAVLLMVGVNGTGKTTTIGKIAWHLSKEFGLSVRPRRRRHLPRRRGRAARRVGRARRRRPGPLASRAPTPAPSPSTRSPPPAPAAPTW